MPTTPFPVQPRTTSPVQPRVQRVTFRGDTTDLPQLQKFQTNMADRLDEVLRFVNTAFAGPAPSKTSGTTAVQQGSSQRAATADKDLVFRGAVSVGGGVLKGSRYACLKVFAASGSISSSTFQMGQTVFAGASPVATHVGVFHNPPFAGSIAGMHCKVFNVGATAGSVTIAASSQSNALSPAWSQTVTFTQANSNSFNVAYTPGQYAYGASPQIALWVTGNGWTQAGGGIEVTLWVYE